MTKGQCMETAKKQFILEASGKTREEVLGNIFAQLRRKVYDEISGVVLHMEPLAVHILSEQKKTFTEKFLWLFMPRQKTIYFSKVNVHVMVKFIQT